MEKHLVVRIALFAAALLPGIAAAADGQILISQSKATAGNVTPGDTPGFPVTISRSGSFRLSSNLVLPANMNLNAIELSDGVEITLDLNGFQIIGPCPRPFGVGACDGQGGTGKGVLGLGAIARIINGTIRGMASDGMDISSNVKLENMRLLENGGSGATLGRGSFVISCMIGGNYGDGILGAHVGLGRGTIQQNVITNNGHIAGGIRVGTGIKITSGAIDGGVLILDNAITDNAGLGLDATGNADAAYGRNLLRGNNGGGVQVVGGSNTGGNR